MSPDFYYSEWERDTLTFQITLVDPSPDAVDCSVYKVEIADEVVYFEADRNLDLWNILEIAVDNLKDCLKIEKI